MSKPKIRFKGFTEEWEQRKLGGIAKSFEYGLNAAAKEYDGENKYIRITDIDDNTHEFLKENVTSPDTDLIIAENYKLVEGDILFARTGASVGKTYIYRHSDGLVYYAGFLIRARIKAEYDTEFIFQNTLTEKYKRYIAVASQRSGQPGVNAQEYSEIKIQVPKREEQAKIGEYFANVDHLITLHQRKCEQTKKLKKYMLQKMFPENGKNVPEIRFERFTDEWEQRKFGELVEKYEDPVETPTDGYMRLGIRSHAKGTFHSYVEKGKELETAKMFRVAADKFIVNITFGWEHAVAITDENDAGKLVSHRFPQYSFNVGMVPKFFRYMILDEKFKHHLELSSPGGAGRNRVLKLSALLEYKMNLPSEIEQRKISECFDSLDHLITLHQRKYEELQKIKKFMLQNMFV